MCKKNVALFTRAWIEILAVYTGLFSAFAVALFTRAWIEMPSRWEIHKVFASPSSRGRGLKSEELIRSMPLCVVALFTRAWIEMICWIF